VSVFRQSIIKICLSIIIFGFTIIVANTNVCANTVTKTISGQAVLTDGVEKARKESINDALGEALNNYIYGDMAVNHKFESQMGGVCGPFYVRQGIHIVGKNGRICAGIPPVHGLTVNTHTKIRMSVA